MFAQDRSAGAQIQEAVKAGCRAICVTLGAPPVAKGARPRASTVKADLPALDALRRSVDVPVLAKGISTPDEAKLALRHDVQGLIVSAYRGPGGPDRDALILTLPAIVDAVGGRAPVLVDGSFRRGTDILKALAFGAQARAGWAAGDVGPCGVRRRRRAGRARDAADRARALHGHVRQVESRGARSHGPARAFRVVARPLLVS